MSNFNESGLSALSYNSDDEDVSYGNQSQSMMNNIERMKIDLKIILLGDAGVGKTAIFTRYSDNKFSENYVATLGVQLKAKDMILDESTMADMKIWDTMGEEKFRAVTKQYYHDCNGIILIFDLTSEDSLQNLSKWIEDINNNAPKNAIVYMVGNKCDKSGRQITAERGRKYADDHNYPYIEASAKTGENIDLLFTKIGTMCYKNLENLNKELEERGGTPKQPKPIVNSNVSKGMQPRKFAIKEQTKSKEQKKVGCC